MTAVSGKCYQKKLSVHAREHVPSKLWRNEVAHVYHIRTNRGKYSSAALMELVSWPVLTSKTSAVTEMLEQSHLLLDKSTMLLKKSPINCLLGLLFFVFFPLANRFFFCPVVLFHAPTLFGDQTSPCCQSVSLNRKTPQDSQKQQDFIFLGHSEPFSGVFYG